MSAYAEWCRPKLTELLASLGLDVEFTKAKGAYLYRRRADGAEIPVLDLVGGFGAGLLGHNNPELKAHLARQLDADAPFLAQSSIRGEAGRLAARLNELLPGERKYLCHFTNSGAEAVEAALKHAYKVRFDALRRRFDEIARGIEAFFNETERAQPDIAIPGNGRDLGRFRDDLDEHNIAELERFQRNPVMLALKGAFHGKTPTALSVTFNKTYREGFEGLSAARPVFLGFDDLARLADIVAEHEIAFLVPSVRDGEIVVETVRETMVIALCLEVIQGEGGMRPLPHHVLSTLAEQHARAGIPYLIDEIQTGCGRTGAFVAYRNGPLAAIAPEYVTLSKALGGGLVKIGAALIRDDVYDPDFGILHTSTFAEDELSASVANRVLDILTRDDHQLMRHVAAKGEYFLRGLEALRRKFPDIVRDVRGRGLMLGLEFGDLNDKSPLFRFGIRQGFLSLLVASYLLHHHDIRLLAPLTTLLKGNPGKRRLSVLRLQPSADITTEEIDRVLRALDEVLRVIARNNEGVLMGHLVGAWPSPVERRDPPAMDVTQPPDEQQVDFDARIGFVVHPAHIHQIVAYYFPSLETRVDRKALAAWWSNLARFLEPDVIHSAYVASEGFMVEANFVSVPFLPAYLVRLYTQAGGRSANPDRAMALRLQEVRDKIQDAVTMARELGDERIPTSLVGLGAYTSIVTEQGTTVNDYEIPITTGNAYTAGLMLQGIIEAAALRNISIGDSTAAVVGAAGNIGAVLAQLLSAHAGRLRLVGREGGGGLERLERTRRQCVAYLKRKLEAGESVGKLGERLSTLGDEVLDDLISIHVNVDAVSDCDIVTVATNSPEARLISPEVVKRGAVVSCASVPSNLSAAFRDHMDDYLVFDGGYARLPEGHVIDCIGLPGGGLAFGCLSETLLLGFDGRNTSFARGPITPAQVEEALCLAERYGFTLGDFKLNEAPRGNGARGARP